MNNNSNNNGKRFAPTGFNSRFNRQYKNFNQYVSHMRQLIEKLRLDLDEEKAEIIIDANSPFEWRPEGNEAIDAKTGKYKHGILLIHGLFDSPNTLQSVADHFMRQNYLVRSILLPGHGTVPGDMLGITYQEWIKATQFGVDSFRNEVEKLYICGFSTGAALALYQAYHDSFCQGLILLAPAIRLHTQFAIMSNINNLLSRTVGGVKWYTKQNDNDYAKYQSFTFNSAHQVYLLTKILTKLNKQDQLQTPVFIAISEDDEVISVQTCINYFLNLSNKLNQMILYGNKEIPLADKRIQRIPSAIPELGILNFSHVCMAVAPEHPHYGNNGDFDDYYHYSLFYGKDYDRAKLKNLPDGIGAITRDNMRKFHLKRLTYNPDFHNMMAEIDKFIARIEAQK